MDLDLTQKARLVAGGYQTDPPKESTYSSVVSCDSIRIAFTSAVLVDNLDVQSASKEEVMLFNNIYIFLKFGSKCFLIKKSV